MNSEAVKDDCIFLVSSREEEEMCSGKVADEQEAVGDGQNVRIECKEDEEGEAQRPHALRDPRTLSPADAHAIQVGKRQTLSTTRS